MKYAEFERKLLSDKRVEIFDGYNRDTYVFDLADELVTVHRNGGLENKHISIQETYWLYSFIIRYFLKKKNPQKKNLQFGKGVR